MSKVSERKGNKNLSFASRRGPCDANTNASGLQQSVLQSPNGTETDISLIIQSSQEVGYLSNSSPYSDRTVVHLPCILNNSNSDVGQNLSDFQKASEENDETAEQAFDSFQNAGSTNQQNQVVSKNASESGVNETTTVAVNPQALLVNAQGGAVSTLITPAFFETITPTLEVASTATPSTTSEEFTVPAVGTLSETQ